jgi:hypothetical protein
MVAIPHVQIPLLTGRNANARIPERSMKQERFGCPPDTTGCWMISFGHVRFDFQLSFARVAVAALRSWNRASCDAVVRVLCKIGFSDSSSHYVTASYSEVAYELFRG